MVQFLRLCVDDGVWVWASSYRGLEETAGLEVELVQGRTLLLDTTGQQLDVVSGGTYTCMSSHRITRSDHTHRVHECSPVLQGQRGG